MIDYIVFFFSTSHYKWLHEVYWKGLLKKKEKEKKKV